MGPSHYRTFGHSDYRTITDFTSFRRQRSWWPPDPLSVFFCHLYWKICHLFHILLSTLTIKGTIDATQQSINLSTPLIANKTQICSLYLDIHLHNMIMFVCGFCLFYLFFAFVFCLAITSLYYRHNFMADGIACS